MNFSKTAIREYVVAALGFLTMIGIDVPVEQVADLLDTAVTDGWGALLMVWAAIGLWLRKITNSPVAQGLKGYFGVKE